MYQSNPKIIVNGPHAPQLSNAGGNLGHMKRSDHIKSAFVRVEKGT
jgi:hypothetical protein